MWSLRSQLERRVARDVGGRANHFVERIALGAATSVLLENRGVVLDLRRGMRRRSTTDTFLAETRLSHRLTLLCPARRLFALMPIRRVLQ